MQTTALKVALQILGRKVFENTEKSSLYSQSFLIFIRKIPVVEAIGQQEKLEIYFGPGQHRQETRSILHEQLAHLHTENTLTKLQT